MNEADALDILQAAIWTIIIASGPAVAAGMIVGVVIALIQALTQVQEMTLTFVPKILAIMITIGISAPFVGAQINLFSNLVFSRIQSGF
ncbi:MAG: flagellar biosynthetic protein FliQ [Alphaproteobacteria bacterium]|jgi:flagellar biosynthetic protein FliQ|uniref:flagellar biosynthetic protein FliQ n=1 Tax=Rhizobium/Agrobacterium group TaxID=227290 RepID=UPI0006B8B516|nr:MULTISPECIES: flagellar biosynthetic protein FliQ [Rhizobium/Agrobacterium group]MBU0737657.1 flagellar biosynthetic protein FliQ [Alphaproteobacteria bacterium]MDM7979207.1 flagellar biosynthetic protein FliQ [Rhizobium sp.]AOG09491.1 bacterial export s, 3 family protein [Agrobacterium sp. RAC06]KPF55201.1 flagellar biosynthetic protein FliQ [Rhizobium sp. AAP116]MBU0834437.1 flagellar biosynthetic protein FliQ [Alphaproteobacteria bacterium]